VSNTAPLRGSEQPGAPTGAGRLALALQEVLTIVARLRAGRQVPTDADAFRTQVTAHLAAAQSSALRAGYPPEYVDLALYVTTALLDESVLNARQPALADWARRPLGNDLFKGHIGGVEVFAQLRQLLSVQDSEALADLLEVYQLCVLLGFRGKYDLGNGGELHGLLTAVEEKVRRIRGGPRPISPDWQLPVDDRPPARRDPWQRRLVAVALVAMLTTMALYAGYRFSLGSSADRLLAEASMVGR
jgi:type VI secretion system protein ImpK